MDGFEKKKTLALKKLSKEAGGFGHLLSEDDNSYWAPPYWNILKETFFGLELSSKSNCKNFQLRVLGLFIKK